MSQDDGGLTALDAEAVRTLARMEARVEAMRETIEYERRWMQGEMQSVTNNIRVVSEEQVRLDTILRGHNGDNGMVSRVKSIEQILELEQEKRKRWDARTWGVAMALISSFIALGIQFLATS